MKTIEKITPFIATHPGEIIKDELEAIGMSQSDFSLQTGYKKSQVNEIIKGKRNINGDLAILLEKVLGIDAEYWMEAQKNYDLDKARIEAKNQKRIEAIEQWKLITPYVPFKFYKKEGVLSGDPLADIPAFKEVYKIDNFEQIANTYAQPTYARFRKSTALQIDSINLVGWVKLVQHKANQIFVEKFDSEKKDELINKLNEVLTFNTNVLSKSKNILSSFGIKLIYQEKGEKTPVDGISFWSNGNPAIGMTLRHSRLDNFAFTLFHELGHIFEHLINNNNSEFIDLKASSEADDYKNSIEEIEANTFATNHLIDEKCFKEFYNSTTDFSDELIVSFSNAIGVHPSIVRGRISFESKSYAKFTKIDNSIG
jgi:HTH-type transcriptional regulator/antitoxin HigA